MKCVICKNGETTPGSTVLTLQRAGRTVVFKDIPAQVCDNCGEAYVDESTAAQLLADAECGTQSGAELEVHRFAPT